MNPLVSLLTVISLLNFRVWSKALQVRLDSDHSNKHKALRPTVISLEEPTQESGPNVSPEYLLIVMQRPEDEANEVANMEADNAAMYYESEILGKSPRHRLRVRRTPDIDSFLPCAT
ncbi:hypothetical protein B0H15DRAFT_68039 [Mycena belliarum]|uniref:Uncharacterized protein n=1 Tax=Mycena belliarum TaxID=1033014 RepID=A0AAD6UCR7_9AGAR|nr:hypothetical protein B0H15DRAFT_68039 [Mycena belliae]